VLEAISDKELFERARKGDTNAQAKLVGLHHGRLVALAHKQLANLHDADDVVQGLWLRVWRGRIPKIEGTFKHWINGALRKRILTRIRKKNQKIEKTRWVPMPTDDQGKQLDGADPSDRSEELTSSDRGFVRRTFNSCLGVKGITQEMLDAYERRKVDGETLPQIAGYFGVKKDKVARWVRKVHDVLEPRLKKALRG
jgi:RNA polymerase sigma factor (sigma-70 family)